MKQTYVVTRADTAQGVFMHHSMLVYSDILSEILSLLD